MSVNSKMTAIADKIRSLLGISGALGMDAMATNLQSAISETESQESLISQIEAALEGKTGAAAPQVTVGTVSVKPTSNSTSISFTGLKGEPKIFAISTTAQITLGSTRYVTSVMYDGDKTHGVYGYRQSSTAYAYYSNAYFTWTYTNGTLKVTANSSTNGGNFTNSVTYELVYVA